MVNISSFGKILRSEGLGIKSIAQKIYKDKTGAAYLVNLKNGSTGVLEVSKDAGHLQQTLKTADKAVEYTTKKTPSMVDVYSKKAADYLPIPQTQSLAYVRTQGAITSASNYKRIPIVTEHYKDPITGQIRTKVKSVQEFHGDKFVKGKTIWPTDTLIGANGIALPIFQRPMKMGEPNVLNVWKM